MGKHYQDVRQAVEKGAGTGSYARHMAKHFEGVLGGLESIDVEVALAVLISPQGEEAHMGPNVEHGIPRLQPEAVC